MYLLFKYLGNSQRSINQPQRSEGSWRTQQPNQVSTTPAGASEKRSGSAAWKTRSVQDDAGKQGTSSTGAYKKPISQSESKYNDPRPKSQSAGTDSPKKDVSLCVKVSIIYYSYYHSINFTFNELLMPIFKFY